MWRAFQIVVFFGVVWGLEEMTRGSKADDVGPAIAVVALAVTFVSTLIVSKLFGIGRHRGVVRGRERADETRRLGGSGGGLGNLSQQPNRMRIGKQL